MKSFINNLFTKVKTENPTTTTTTTTKPDDDAEESKSNPIECIHPLSETPTKAWEQQLKFTNIVQQVQPMPLDSPIRPDHVRFVAISDTHSSLHQMKYQIPAGDVLIHAGDFSNHGAYEEVRKFNTFLGSLPHPYKLVIAGNHELTFDRDPQLHIGEKFKDSESWIRHQTMYGAPDPERNNSSTHPRMDPRTLLTNCTYLQDSGIEIYGLKIFGSPWQPWFYDWGFNVQRGGDCLNKWNLIPDNTDILITHGPPIGHGDLCRSGARAGCVELLNTIQERIKPKFHVFGHIHEGYGITSNLTTTFINASICRSNYVPSNPPIIFDVALSLGLNK